MTKQALKPSDFVHLHNHTHYSLLDGLQKVPELLDKVKASGMEAVAITDHGTLSGAIEFYKGCKERGLKPIIGMEGYVAARGHQDRDPQKDKARYHIVLLAMNNQGYENLMRLSSIAALEGFYFKPRVDHDLLEKYNEGLIVLSGCLGGELGEHIMSGQYEQAREIASWYKKTFNDRYYIELQDHGFFQPRQKELNDQLLKLADELEIPVVVTSDAHYLDAKDEDAHEILLCVQTGAFLSEENRMSLKGWHLYVSEPDDVIKRWQDVRPDAVANTKKIADKCQIDIELGKILIPKFDVPKGYTEHSYLHELVYQGLAWRYTDKYSEESAKKLNTDQAKKALPKQVLERAEYELGVIEKMGYNGYFLIVWDFINWGKQQGIVYGPGRGSAAGSIVSYAIRITEVDPLQYGLLFERFLNPDRISMPDIDVDIQDSRRDEVIAYVTEKYGADRVANIVTFGRMAARNAVRDTARVLQVPYAEADRLAKMLPEPIQGRHVPLKVSLEKEKDLTAEYSNNPQSKRVLDMAVRLEGTIRSHGVHAAGVVIAPDEIVKYSPLEMAQKGVVATQYSMNPIEELGLLKMDFLGLSNLTIIKNTLRIIKKVYGKTIDIDDLPLDDQKTYELLSRGDTTGVFQLESSGMKEYLRKLKPEVFEDIAAMTALYRPGPLGAGLIDHFINRKNGIEEVEVPHPAFESALATTYGTLVYQEQVMQISRDVCGFTGGESDTLRKAVGKKIREVMLKMEERFINGGVEHSGVPKAVMEQFWQDLLGFADYAFNKSHSVCYGLIAYQTAYLKAHYPDAFMAALMTSDAGNTDRLTIEISECINKGIQVLPPDVNESFHEFAIIGGQNTIRFGLDAVKNVGHGAVAEIIKARDLGGKFESLEDFVDRVSPSQVNRKTWESLIKAGAFDQFADRGTLLNSLDDIVHVAQKLHKEKNSGQVDLFGGTDDNSVTGLNIVLSSPESEVTNNEMLQWERELLGLYLTHHPLEDFRDYIQEKAIGVGQLEQTDQDQNLKIAGVVTEVKEITTKTGQPMAFAKIEDFEGEIEVIVFPRTMEKTKSVWQVDKVLMVDGKVDFKGRDGSMSDIPKILASNASEIDSDKAKNYKSTGKPKLKKGTDKIKPVEPDSTPKILFIRLLDSSNGESLVGIKNLLEQHQGSQEVVLVLGPDNSKQTLRLPIRVNPQPGLIQKLEEVVGRDKVKLA